MKHQTVFLFSSLFGFLGIGLMFFFNIWAIINGGIIILDFNQLNEMWIEVIMFGGFFIVCIFGMISYYIQYIRRDLD